MQIYHTESPTFLYTNGINEIMFSPNTFTFIGSFTIKTISTSTDIT